MNNQTFPHIASVIQRSCKQLHLTRDEIVRATGMGNDKASAVWNGKDVRISYYLEVLKLLFKRSFNPRYKYPPHRLIEDFLKALQEELSFLSPLWRGLGDVKPNRGKQR